MAAIGDARRLAHTLVTLLPIPVFLTFALMMGVHAFDLTDRLFLVSALKIPDDFVHGVMLALLLRVAVLNVWCMMARRSMRSAVRLFSLSS